MIIVVIAEKGFHELYHPFKSGGNKVYACSPDESKEVVNKYRTDLILLDCGFEVDSGLELLKELKTSCPRAPVIFLTDIGSEDIVLKAFKTGARDFFKKPINIFELQETVDGILSVRKATRESRHPFKSIGSQTEELLNNITTGQPINLIRVIRYIEENLSSPITLENLAKEANCSKYHFCRLFKTRIGMSPMKFVISMRVLKAKELLKREDSNVSMVASTVGFNDLSSFIVQFKKFAGVTPIKFKKSLKK